MSSHRLPEPDCQPKSPTAPCLGMFTPLSDTPLAVHQGWHLLFPKHGQVTCVSRSDFPVISSAPTARIWYLLAPSLEAPTSCQFLKVSLMQRSPWLAQLPLRSLSHPAVQENWLLLTIVSTSFIISFVVLGMRQSPSQVGISSTCLHSYGKGQETQKGTQGWEILERMQRRHVGGHCWGHG